MECLICGYSLELRSVLAVEQRPDAKLTIYHCANCGAHMTVFARLLKPSPLPPDELKRRTNGVGSHTIG